MARVARSGIGNIAKVAIIAAVVLGAFVVLGLLGVLSAFVGLGTNLAPSSNTTSSSTSGQTTSSSTSSQTPATSSSSSKIAEIIGMKFFAESAGPLLFSAPTCGPAEPSSGNFIIVKFSGASPGSLSQTSFTYGGKTVTNDVVGTSCQFQPNSSVYVVFQNVGTGPAASVGETYSGSLTLADGTILQFSGTFQ